MKHMNIGFNKERQLCCDGSKMNCVTARYWTWN